MSDLRERIQKLVDIYECYLCSCGMDGSNINYDKLAKVRANMWSSLEQLILSEIEDFAERVLSEEIRLRDCEEVIPAIGSVMAFELAKMKEK